MAISADPELSVVVAIVSDTTSRPDLRHVEQCLAALGRQTDPPPMEIIVPYHPFLEGITNLQREYPQVRFEQAADLATYLGHPGSREHHDELRARGLAAARGRIVALIEDHGIPAPDWSRNIIEAHAGNAAGIGGAIENGINRPLNWAVCFCDFLRYQLPFEARESDALSDANVSYKRDKLEAVRAVWKQVFHESSVNQVLRRKGERLELSPKVVLLQNRLGLRLAGAMKERFIWGRSYAATRARLAGSERRILWAVFAPALPILILSRMSRMALEKRARLGAFVRAFPLTAALIVSWSCGEFCGYTTGRANSAGAHAAEAIATGLQEDA